MNYTTGKATYYADKFVAANGRLGFIDNTGAVTFGIVVSNDSGRAFNFDENQKFTFTPNGNTSASISYGNTTISNIIANGTFTYDRKNLDLNVPGNTSLTATVAGRTVKLTTTADAGGELSFDKENLSITYTPQTEDGSLELTVTENGKTRSATLSCVGTVTYKLGGDLELSAGTTLTSTWDNGYSLSISTNRTASAKISLTSEGLQITPNDSDSVVAQLTKPNGATISNIKVNGTVVYDSGNLILKSGSALTGTSSGNIIQYSAVNANATLSFDDMITFTPGIGGSIVGTAGNVTNTYSNGAFKVDSDTDVVILSPNVKVATTGTAAQKFIMENSGTYNINNKDYTLKDNDGVNLSYSTGGIEADDLDGTISFADNVTVTVSNDSLSADLAVNASVDVGVRSATIDSDGYFGVNSLTNFDIYTLKSARDGKYTLGGSLNISVTNDDDYNFLFDSSGKVTLSDISDGASIKTNNTEMAIVNDTEATYYINGNTIEAGEETAVTINNDDVIFNPNDVTYNGLKFNGTTSVTMPADGSISLLANESIELSEGEYTINGTNFELLTDATIGAITDGFRVNREWVRITGDNNYSLKVSSSGIETVEGVSSGATVKGNGQFAVKTDTIGIYTFGSNNYTLAGDNSVDLDITFNSDTATITSVDIAGTISGNFTNSATVDGVAVQVSGDENINIITRNNSVVTISGVSDGASVMACGKNTALRLESAGNYYLNGVSLSTGNASAVRNNSAGNFVNFAIANATVTGTSENDTINNSGTNSYINGGNGDDLIVNSGNNATIIASSGRDTIINSGANVSVNAATNFTITDDSNYTVLSGDAVTVRGLSADATVTANGRGYINAVTDSEGKYTFGNDALTISGDNSVTISANNNSVRSISNLQGTLIFTTKATQTINDNTLTITPTGQLVTVTTNNSGTIRTIAGLAAGTTLKPGLTGNYIINGEAVRITDTVNQTISITNSGVSVIYPTTAIENLWLSNSSSDYISTLESYNEANSDTYNGNLVYYLNGNAAANFSATTGKKKVISGDGTQSIVFNDEGNNISSIQAETSGAKTVMLGDGGDIVIIEDTDAQISVKTGKGADSISTHGDNVIIDFSDSGTARVLVSGGNVTLNNYDHNTGAGIQGIYGADDNSFTIADNCITMLGSRIFFNDNNGSSIFNMYDTDGTVAKFGFAYLNGGVVDMADQTQGASLISRNGNSTLIGGSGDDTVDSGGDDFINAGAGNNIINLNHRNTSSGATILATEGHNTVDGLYTNVDKIQILDIDSASFTYGDGDVTIREGTARTLIQNSSSADSNGEYTTLLLQNSKGDIIRTSITDNSTINADTNNLATAYIGTRAGVDFSDLSGNLNLNLQNNSGTYNDNDLYFKGINKLKAGSGNSSMIASNSNSTLITGTGNTSMLGGSGNDLLVGNIYKTDTTEYFFTANGGNDTITNFRTADKINTFNVALTAVRTQNNDVIVDFGNNSLRIVDAVDVDVKFNDLVAKIGDNRLTYDDTATYYQATGTNATLEVASSVSGASIWLNTPGNFNGDIRTLDASNVNGNATLVGNYLDNVIIAGGTHSSLWGSSGGNDTLIGSNSDDMFWYMLGDGNDVITNADDNDSINLYGVTLSDITAAEITTSGVKLSFKDSGTLSVVGGSVNSTFMLDGTNYKANQTTGQWEFA